MFNFGVRHFVLDLFGSNIESHGNKVWKCPSASKENALGKLYSDQLAVTNVGDSQGSVLGPVIFYTRINNIWSINNGELCQR